MLDGFYARTWVYVFVIFSIIFSSLLPVAVLQFSVESGETQMTGTFAILFLNKILSLKLANSSPNQPGYFLLPNPIVTSILSAITIVTILSFLIYLIKSRYQNYYLKDDRFHKLGIYVLFCLTFVIVLNLLSYIKFGFGSNVVSASNGQDPIYLDTSISFGLSFYTLLISILLVSIILLKGSSYVFNAKNLCATNGITGSI